MCIYIYIYIYVFPPAETKCGEILKWYPNRLLNCFNKVSKTEFC